jgi:predicted histidine transporter YuiF (NhaC family)
MDSLELLQAIVVHGGLDLPAALTMQSCNKLTRTVVDDFMETILADDDTTPVVWFARMCNMPLAPPSLAALKPRLANGDTELMVQVLVPNIEKIFFDITMQDRFVATCFTLGPDARFNGFADGIFYTFTKIFTGHITTWKENKTHSKSALLTAFALFSKVIRHLLLWLIAQPAPDVFPRGLGIMQNIRFLMAVRDKLGEFLQICDLLQNVQIRTHVVTEMTHTKKLVHAWIRSVTTQRKLHVGKKGGLYTMSASGRRYYIK